MAIYANIDASVTINAVDLSDHVVSCEWTETVETVDSVAMGASLYSVAPTFKRVTFDVEFQQDFAASNVYATLFAAFDANVAIAVKYRHTSAVVGATNPEQQTNMLLTNLPVGSGAIGDIATITINLVGDGTAVTRAVA